MALNLAWQEFYQAALLELRPENLRRKIDEAERAIQQRIEELGANDTASEKEREALCDAQRGLRVLASTECPAPETGSGAGQNEVAS